MGFLNNLFRKKNQSEISPVHETDQNDSPANVSQFVNRNGFWFYEQTPSKQAIPRNDDIESIISRNPLSTRFRIEVQESEHTFDDVDFAHFVIQCDGKFTVLDVETTGLNCTNDAIIEIALVKVENGEIIDRYHHYVDPGIPISKAASEVNHITDDMVAGQPRIYEILPNILEFVGDDIIVAHNASFDLKFLGYACLRYRFRCPCLYFDSMRLKERWPDVQNKKLQAFLNAAGIENKNAHSASGDAEALALLMIKSMKEFHVKMPEDIQPSYSVEHFTGPVDLIDNTLAGKRFVITGEINGYERYDLEKLICSHGGKATVKISSATDYLVVGTFTGFPDGYVSSKVEYARKLIETGGKISIISPDELFDMMN